MDTRTRKKPVYNLHSGANSSHLLPEHLIYEEEVKNLQIREETTANESVEYEVSCGDTLASIAAINKITISDLMRENKLISPIICPGQLIRIPKQSPYGSYNSLRQAGGSLSSSKEDIKIVGGYEKVPMKRQRSISEYKGPRRDLLAIPETLTNKIDNKPKSRKTSLAVLVENVKSKFSRPSSPHEVPSFKQRAKSVAVPPKLSYLDFGDEKKERKVSEVKQKPPDPVSFSSEILHPEEDQSSGTLQLDGERLQFESYSSDYLSSYLFYSLNYEDIINVTLWKTCVNTGEPLNFRCLDQFHVIQVMDELKNKVQQEHVYEEESICAKYVMSAEITKDSPFFITQDRDSSKIWFSVFPEKLVEVDRHLSLALPHCYSNLPWEAKIELLYDLKVKLLKGEFYDVNQNGSLNAFVKFKVEKTSVFKSKTIHGGLKPDWNESFEIDNIIPDDVIQVKVYHGSTAIGRSFIPASKFPLKVSQSLTLEMERVDESQPLKVGYIYLECLLLPKGSPAKMACVPHPCLHPPSKIISRFHVAKLCENLPALLSSTQRWRLIYSNVDHGSSLTTLYGMMGGCSNDDCVILVIRDTEQKVFGAYLTSPIKPSRSFYGTGECFLFTFHPFFQKFASSGLNMCFIRSDDEGISIGSGKAGDGLWIHENMWDGCTNISETYNNLPLTSDKTFHIHSVETWKIEV